MSASIRDLPPGIGTRPPRARRWLSVLLSSLFLLVATATGASAVQSTTTPAANPPMPSQCELDLAISLDLSNSVTADQLGDMREAVAELLSALSGYPVRIAIHNFASYAPATSAASNEAFPLTSLTPAGVTALTNHVNGIARPVSGNGGTNWDAAFAAVSAASESYDALLFVTDGNPTQYRSGTGVAGPGSSTDVTTITRAVTSANALKASGTRIVPIGLSDNLTGQGLIDFTDHITQVSGPTEGSDYFISGFTRLAQPLIEVANLNCAEITLDKVGELSAGEEPAVGSTVDYSFTVTNTGQVTLTDVAVSDPKPGLSAITYSNWPGAPGTLAPGESVTATATYTLTAADVAAGTVHNTATATGQPPSGDPVEDEDPADVTITSSPSIEVVKTGGLAAGATGAAGDVVTYDFTVTNTGNVTLTNVELDDPMPGLSAITFGTWPGAAGRLAPGQSVTASATYVLTQADVNAGGVDNTVTATGNPPGGPDVTDTDEENVPVAGAPAIQVLKSGALPAGAAGVAGDVVTYEFTVTNTGNVTLNSVELDDPMPGLSAITFGTWPGAAGTLAPGQSVTASATYVLTQADVNAGGVDNTVTTAGTPPSGEDVTDTDEENVPVAGAPAIHVLKTGALAAGATGAAGDLVTYEFTVTNTGNVTLTDVELDDPMPGLSAITFGTWPGAAGRLAPGQSVTASATYALTQADVDAGEVANTVTTTGTPPSGEDVTDTDEEDVQVQAGPRIDVVKTAGLAAGATGVAGDVVTYEFTVTNTGNVTLNNVELDDPMPGLSTITFGTWPGAAGRLQPGQSVTASATYVLTQADVNAGEVANTVTATGTPPTGEPVENEDTEDVPLPQRAVIDLVKTGALAPGATGAVGSEIDYTFTVTNTGNVTLTDVEIDDPMPGLSDITFGVWPGAVGTLAPGQSVTASATYVLTQADVDAGGVDNTATTAGTPPQGEDVTDTDDENVPVAGDPRIQVVKTGGLAAGAAGVAGDVVTYEFTVTNTGNVTLNNVELDDPMPGLSSITFGTWPGAAGTLAPGQTVTASATYVLTQADVNAGGVDNTVTTTGTPPSGEDVTDTDEETVPVAGAPAIHVLKTGALAAGAAGVAGDVVTYEFTVTNTGNVTLNGVELDDPMPGLSDITFGTWPGAAGRLQPGQSVTASATYVLTQADVDAGEVDNTVTTTGTPPSGEDVTDTDEEDVQVQAGPRIDVVKTAGLAAGATGAAGDVVTYEFTVTNTGNVTLNNVELDDPMPGLSDITFGTWPGAEGRLAPGQSVTASASYVLTQADVDAGEVANTVTATGTPPTGEPVENEDTEDVQVPQRAVIDLVKTGALADDAAGVAGDVVAYEFTVTNTGNVTLTDVEIDDPMPGLSDITFGTWPGAAGTLAPGQTVTASATYVLTQADVDAGGVDNTATTIGTPPQGEDVTDTDEENVPVERVPGIDVVKTGALAPGATHIAGDRVNYQFVITNTGNVTLTGVTLADLMPGLSEITYGEWPGAAGTLAPGQTVTASASYVLTQADVEAGAVHNTVTTTGTPPGGEDVTDTDEETIPVTELPVIDLIKSGALASGATGVAGDKVTYTFTVTNRGNVTLTNVTLADPLPGLSAITFGEWPGAVGTLAPGQTVTASATYVLTQADVDAGKVDNTATTTGTPPRGGQVSDTDVETVPTAPGSSVDLLKQAELVEGAASVAGDRIKYTFTVTNTGTSTLRGVAITDALPGLSEITYGAWPQEVGVLAPGQSVQATAWYTLTQADIDRGYVHNEATVAGDTTFGTKVVSADDEDSPLPGAGALTLEKTGSVDGNQIRYRFVVTNTGNVTLTDVKVRDELKGLSDIAVERWPGKAGTLKPGEKVVATATYRITDEDRDRGRVDNHANATGLTPGGDKVGDADKVRVVVATLPDTGAPIGLMGALLAGLLALIVGAFMLRPRRS